MGSPRLVPWLALAGAALGCGAGKAPEPTVVIAPQVMVREAPPAPARPPAVECPPSCIPDTEVSDTPENRAVLAFCERYRQAVIAKDVPLLLSLVSPRYRDDGGTPDVSDDIDASGLRTYITQHFAEMEGIEYALRYKRIVRKGSTIHVECTVDAAYARPGRTTVRRHDENTLVLEQTRGGFLILSGM